MGNAWKRCIKEASSGRTACGKKGGLLSHNFAQAMLDKKVLPCKPSFQVVTGVIKAVLWAHYAKRHSHWHVIPGHHLRTSWDGGCLHLSVSNVVQPTQDPID